jgi:hypothetical protein
MSNSKLMQSIVSAYREAGRPWPAQTNEIARWAIKEGYWELSESNAIRKCAQDLSKAMREDYETDSKGRRVRKLHPVKKYVNGKQVTIWDGMDTAEYDFMCRAFQQRRQSIVADCHQLKTDVDSYNDRKPDQPPIQMIFEFTNDLLEIEFSEAAA